METVVCDGDDSEREREMVEVKNDSGRESWLVVPVD